jgi:hypothetical protein
MSEIQTRRRTYYTRVARENRSTDILEKRVMGLVEVLAELVLRARSRGGPEAVRKKTRERRDRRDEKVKNDASCLSTSPSLREARAKNVPRASSSPSVRLDRGLRLRKCHSAPLGGRRWKEDQ